MIVKIVEKTRQKSEEKMRSLEKRTDF